MRQNVLIALLGATSAITITDQTTCATCDTEPTAFAQLDNASRLDGMPAGMSISGQANTGAQSAHHTAGYTLLWADYRPQDSEKINQAPDAIASPEDCEAFCAGTAGCKFFRFRPSNGLCATYSTANYSTRLHTPNLSTYSMLPPPPPAFTLLWKDYRPQDSEKINQAPAAIASPEDCEAFCAGTAGCKFFRFRPSNGLCATYSTANYSTRLHTYNLSTYAMLPPPPPPAPPAFTLLWKDYRPQDSEKISQAAAAIASPEDCEAYCAGIAGCKFFRFRPSNGLCAAYSTADYSTRLHTYNLSTYAMLPPPPPAPPAYTLLWKDYRPQDSEKISQAAAAIASPEDCEAYCAGIAGCKFFRFRPSNGLCAAYSTANYSTRLHTYNLSTYAMPLPPTCSHGPESFTPPPNQDCESLSSQWMYLQTSPSGSCGWTCVSNEEQNGSQ